MNVLERLFAEVTAIYQKEDAARAAEFDQAIDEVDGGKGLALQ